MTVAQRFGSALNLNVHFHTLMMRNLDARGDDDGAGFISAEPALATLAGASVAGVAASGPRRGARTMRLGSGATFETTSTGRRCAAVEGFSLHANVRVAANDRDGLEHLARYLARPPIATDRLTVLPDGRLALRFKRPITDGTEAVAFTPFALIERLLPLIPRPRKHILRFHGILAPAAGNRSKIVPAADTSKSPKDPGAERRTPHRLPWAELLRRVFLVDVLDCPRCHARMRIVAAVTDPEAIEPILRHLGETAQPRAIAGPRAPPPEDAEAAQLQLDLVDPDPDPRRFVLTCTVGSGESWRAWHSWRNRGPCFPPAGPPGPREAGARQLT